MAEISLYGQRAKIRNYKKGLYAFYLLETGIALGLFEKINICDAGISPGALAVELGLHEPYVNIWCQTAYHLEILDCDTDGKFTLAPHMGTLLADTDTPFYLGREICMRTSYTVEHLKRHAEYFRTGKLHSNESDGEQFSKVQKTMTNQSIPGAYEFFIIPSIPALKERLEEGTRFLDVGCGSGFLMVQLAKAFPNSKFLGVEIDRFAVEDAQRYINENGVQDRVSAMLVDANSMDFIKKFDVVNMAIVLHEIQSDSKQEIVANCYRALSDSGQIVIFDFAYPEGLHNFRNPEYTEGILDQFHELAWGSEHLSSVERHRLLLQHGFKDPITISIVDGSYEVTHAKK